MAAPAEAIAWFAEKVRLDVALDPKRIRRLMADLGSDAFAVREAASKAIQSLDQQAIPYLEETLRSTESAEVRARVETILKHQRAAAIPSEQLRQIRAVTVLELIGDGKAIRLLKEWAGGPAGSLLTEQASAALQRIQPPR